MAHKAVGVTFEVPRFGCVALGYQVAELPRITTVGGSPSRRGGWYDCRFLAGLRGRSSVIELGAEVDARRSHQAHLRRTRPWRRLPRADRPRVATWHLSGARAPRRVGA